MNGKLENNAALKAQLDAVSAGAATSAGAQNWYAKLAKFFQDVQAGIPSKLQDADFLRRLWDENPVAATGMGSVKMAPALQDADFKSWFAAEVAKPLPSESAEAEAHLTALYNGLRDRLKVLCGRTPRLKLNRVLCALFPQHFTTVADPGKLLYLHKEMGGRGERPSCACPQGYPNSNRRGHRPGRCGESARTRSPHLPALDGLRPHLRGKCT